jgi:hypothetical protein
VGAPEIQVKQSSWHGPVRHDDVRAEHSEGVLSNPSLLAAPSGGFRRARSVPCRTGLRLRNRAHAGRYRRGACGFGTPSLANRSTGRSGSCAGTGKPSISEAMNCASPAYAANAFLNTACAWAAGQSTGRQRGGSRGSRRSKPSHSSTRMSSIASDPLAILEARRRSSHRATNARYDDASQAPDRGCQAHVGARIRLGCEDPEALVEPGIVHKPRHFDRRRRDPQPALEHAEPSPGEPCAERVSLALRRRRKVERNEHPMHFGVSADRAQTVSALAAVLKHGT